MLQCPRNSEHALSYTQQPLGYIDFHLRASPHPFSSFSEDMSSRIRGVQSERKQLPSVIKNNENVKYRCHYRINSSRNLLTAPDCTPTSPIPEDTGPVVHQNSEYVAVDHYGAASALTSIRSSCATTNDVRSVLRCACWPFLEE